jgi:HEPN domain-containing protein
MQYDRAMRPRDTTREAFDAQRAAWRRLGPARRVELAFEMSEQAREISIRGALAREPGLAPEEARARLLRRLLGDALYRAAWRTAVRR